MAWKRVSNVQSISLTFRSGKDNDVVFVNRQWDAAAALRNMSIMRIDFIVLAVNVETSGFNFGCTVKCQS